MSWISKNYEKVAIVGALAAGLGCAYLGYSGYQSIEQELTFGLAGPRNNNNAMVAGAEDLPGALNSRAASHVWEQHKFNGRPVNLFTGVPLFVKRDAAEPVDLLTSPPVHPPIANDWWLKYDLNPSYADSPSRDTDGDGFSELEEYLAKTDPTRPQEHPPLISKLSFVSEETRTWLLEFSSDIGEGQYQFKYSDVDSAGRKGANRTDFIAAGTKFFAEGAAANRFELVEVNDIKSVNEKTGIEEVVKTATVRDLRPTKNNETFEVPRQMRNKAAFYRYDRSATLVLKAINEGGNQFKVEENTSFSLPSGQPEKPYKVLKVTPDAVVVEYPGGDGKRTTVTIPKGGTADSANAALPQ